MIVSGSMTTLRRLRVRGRPGHGAADVRRPGVGDARPWVPEQILTDNAEVFTARFGPGPGPVLFAGSAPTTGSAICSRRHAHRPRPARSSGGTRRCAASSSTARCSTRLMTPRPSSTRGWLTTTLSGRTSRSVGCRPSNGSSSPRRGPVRPKRSSPSRPPSRPVTTRRVSAQGAVSFAAAQYKAGVWLAGQEVEVVCDGGLVQLHDRGVLIAIDQALSPRKKVMHASRSRWTRDRGARTRPHSPRDGKRPAVSRPTARNPAGLDCRAPLPPDPSTVVVER